MSLEELTIFHIKPLDWLPTVGISRITWGILKLVLYIWLPGNVLAINIDWNVVLCQTIWIVEYRLCNKSAGNCNITRVRRIRTRKHSYVIIGKEKIRIDVSICVYWITGLCTCDLLQGARLAHKLLVITGFYISTMVLVEVVKLIININWLNNLRLYRQWHWTHGLT